MWELDEDRRKLLVLRKMLANLEQAVEDTRNVVVEMEEHLFEEYEMQRIAR